MLKRNPHYCSTSSREARCLHRAFRNGEGAVNQPFASLNARFAVADDVLSPANRPIFPIGAVQSSMRLFYD